MADAPAETKRAVMSLGHETLEIVDEYVAPLAGLVFGGLVMPGLIGGSAMVWQAEHTLTNGASDSAVWQSYVTQGVTAVIYFGIGASVWHMASRFGNIGKIAFKFLGAAFIGGGIRLLFYAVANNAGYPNTGILDKLTNEITSVAGQV